MPDFELLWTDLMLYLLVAGILAYALYVRRRPELCEPWRRVAGRPLGMAAAVVLAAYLGIALLDSVHYRPADGQGGIVSLLDTLLAPLRVSEKTYSAPLAAYQFSAEFIAQPDGSTMHVRPRLRHGGSHLQDPQSERTVDALMGAGRGLLLGAGAWLLLALIVLSWQAHSRRIPLATRLRLLRDGNDAVPWKVILLTLGGLLLLGGVAASLSADYHLFGTDKVGQDVLYQSLKSVRTGMLIGTLTTLFMMPLALFLGIAAGYFRGWFDDAVQYLYTTLASIPWVLLVAAAVLLGQVWMEARADQFASLEQRADLRLLLLCLILGVTSWTSLCRLLRAETLKLREVEYVQAAQALGARHLGVQLRHVLPNVMHIIFIVLVLDFSGLVLAEAVLSYVNLGVDPTTQSWGNMINSARLELAREPVVWWPLTAAFIFMLGLVLPANIFADAVRDAFDPRLKGSRV